MIDEEALNRENTPEFFEGAIICGPREINCPKCNKSSISDYMNSLIESTIAEERYTFDRFYHWYEKHKCTNCETVYIVENGS